MTPKCIFLISSSFEKFLLNKMLLIQKTNLKNVIFSYRKEVTYTSFYLNKKRFNLFCVSSEHLISVKHSNVKQKNINNMMKGCLFLIRNRKRFMTCYHIIYIILFLCSTFESNQCFSEVRCSDETQNKLHLFLLIFGFFKIK